MDARLFALFCLCILFVLSDCDKDKTSDKKDSKKAEEKWKKKDIRDYDDADLERLYEQWEEDEEPLEEDELPEYKRKPPKIDMSKINTKDPQEMLKMSKKGRSLMMFASVAGNPTEKETEKITALWHSSLFNANIETTRHVVGSNRVLFYLKDGAQAWDIKDFLVKQENCDHVTIDGQTYPGKGSKDPDAKPYPAGSKSDKPKKEKEQKKSKKSSKKSKKKEEL